MRRQLSPLVALYSLLLMPIPSLVGADDLQTADGLRAQAEGPFLSAISIDGEALEGVRVEALLQRPRSGEPVGAGFSVEGEWKQTDRALILNGVARADGETDRVADLIVRVEGVSLALSTMDEDPLLQPRKLLSKLPIVSLRTNGQDSLALALPPDSLAICEFGERDGGVDLRFPLGFTADAKPSLRMCAPFSCMLYRTDPRWHYRSALAGYYALFPEPFEPFIREQGGWFFAAPTTRLPNPQHFYYHEGGPSCWADDDERGLGTYPYRESSSYTISLEGSDLPKSHDEAMRRLLALEDRRVPRSWAPASSMRLVDDVAHSGEFSVLADNSASGDWTGGRQAMALDPPWEEPILVRGFSRAEGVTGSSDKQYSIYVDVCYAGGGYKFAQCATFNTGTHDWERSEYVIEPEEPVAELRCYCLLRGHRGKAWFDDVHVGPAGDPQVNWLDNPGFEELGRRDDIQHIRDNVCYDAQDRWVLRITDNLSADVGPTTPLNLLRFTLNVDPDIPDTEDRPNVAGRQFEHFDRIFEASPSVDGCYIDSVSAWCSRVMNTRRDQWAANDAPFTYDPDTLRVAAHGRFAMADYLETLQERYHPIGKPIFTNIHTSLDSFPLYLVSDVPGIESSRYRDQDSMFFYRACSHKKPLMLLNFMNLHGLDQRNLAETYHLNAAQWGEFPSTGRFVERAYAEYGDVTHAYMPAIKELGAAGWEPIPLASGARVERFAGDEAAYFTVRAAERPGEETLVIAPQALDGLGEDLVAMDAVWLSPLEISRVAQGYAMRFTHGARELRIVRICPRRTVPRWLLNRARGHVVGASRVQGKASMTPDIQRALDALAACLAEAEVDAVALVALRDGLAQAYETCEKVDGNLFHASRATELLQAGRALTELAAFASGSTLGLEGNRIGAAGDQVILRARSSAPQGVKVRLAGIETSEGRCIVPGLGPVRLQSEDVPEQIVVTGKRPGVAHVRALFELDAGAGAPWVVERAANVFFLPCLEMEVGKGTRTARGREYTVSVRKVGAARGVTVSAACDPPAAVAPEAVAMTEAKQEMVFSVEPREDGVLRQVTFVGKGGSGVELGSARTSFLDEPDLPEGDLALAERGASVTSDSSYSSYSPSVVIDGINATGGLHWTARAWASADGGSPHWLRVALARPQSISRVLVYWNIEAEKLYSARDYRIVGVTGEGEEVLAEVSGGPSRTVSVFEFPSVAVSAVRIEQAQRGGAECRPGIMWVREVCVLR